METKSTRNWIIIAIVLGISALWLYPPQKKLVPGPDLAGGTTLLYDVNIPEGADRQQTLKRVIEVVSKRVDPAGVRNLVFQIEAGGRIQILMPHPSADVVAKRQEYQDLLLAVTESNITQGQVFAALRADAGARPRLLDALVKGVANRKALLESAARQHDAVAAAKKARQEAKAEPGSAKDIELAGKIAEAEIAFDATLKKIEGTNIDPVALGHALELPGMPGKDPTTGKPAAGGSPRDQALAAFYALQPDRRDQIVQLMVAYDAYFLQKRPLEDPNDLIRLVKGQGVLEFHITVDPEESVDADSLRESLRQRGPRALPPDARMRWYQVDDINEWIGDVADNAAKEQDRPRSAVLAQLQQELKEDPGTFFLRYHGLVGGTDGKAYYLLLWNTPDRSLTQSKAQAGWQLTTASPDRDQLGRPAVGFRMNEVGGNYMGELTKNNLKRRMAILLDGRVYSAPTIQSEIHGSGVITGRFSQTELDYLINTLSAGSLQASLSSEPIEIRTIQPTLGKDNLQRGLRAGFSAMIAVAAFMIGYYFFGGVVANLAMLANLVIILGIMATLKANFTLPGIAGIILNVGMCVDANVLIFERIREALRRGAPMLTALRLGHDKAFSAILDGNLTTLIVCVVMGYLGTADIKGFGITLGIGLVANLFTAVFMAHVILQGYFRRFPHQKMEMLPLVVPAVERVMHPQFTWMNKRRLFYTASLSTSLLGIVLCFARGQELFDIEFRSGTEVTFDLKSGSPMSRQQVADGLKAAGLQDATVVIVGKSDEQLRASSFSVVTTNPDSKAVGEAIRKAVGPALNIQPVLRFKGDGAADAPATAVFPITAAELDKVIGRDAKHDVGGSRGGGASLLEGRQPSASGDDLSQRIKAMRLQPEYEQMQFRPFEVVGLSPDPDQADHYTAAVVVTRDPTVDYFDNEEAWRQSVAGVEWKLVHDALTREQSFTRVSRFTPTVARTLVNNAIVAVIVSCLAIIAYIWIRFGSLRYGIAAIVALVHDVTIVLGLLAIRTYFYEHATGLADAIYIIPFKINMSVIAAVLTVIGYSINDTIIVFDRIRENRGKLDQVTPKMIDDSVNQTLSRTFLTSGTTFIAILTLYLFGGEAIRAFAFCMLIGVITGTYSSFAIASPLLLWGMQERSTTDQPIQGQPSVAKTA